MSGRSKFQISRSLDERIKRIIGGTNEFDTEFAQVQSAYILGFNYGNVTNCVGLTTNYQLHHAVFPVVGVVFFKTSPGDEEIKATLRSIKEYSSSPNGLGSFKSDKNEHLFLIYNIDKVSNDVEKRIFNFTKGSFVRRRRLRLNVLNDPFCPRQVHKGSEDLFPLGDGDSLSSADDDHIDHLIFFIHGVGGVCDVRFRSCAEVVADFKKLANNLLVQQSNPSSGASTPSNAHIAQNLKKGFFRKHSSDSSQSSGGEVTETTSSIPQARARRVECLPVSWHSCTRRQTGMNDQLALIALSSVPKLRHFLNKVVIDALLYASGPVYSQTIINNVGDEINRLYTLFLEKHPNFNGSVSLAGHSLGSVIVFDLLANQVPEPETPTPTATTCNAPTTTTANTTSSPKESSASTASETSNITHNNNMESNNNNQHNVGQTDCKDKAKNARQSCLNASHHHHNLNPGIETERCYDYKNLEELLADMDLLQYASLFHKEHIDINTLLLLTDSDMKELNLPFGPRRKLGTYINFKKVSKMSTAPMTDGQQNQSNTHQQQNLQSNTHQQTNLHPTGSENKSDINSNREPGQINGNGLVDIMNTGQYLIKYPQLKFKPRCFFSFGSPMPMFLNVRGAQDISKDYKLPTCDRMLNIFHPYDPLAYRIEPLIDPRFKSIEPVQIPHHRGGKRIHVQLREGFARVGHDIKHRLLGSLRNTWSSFTRFNGRSSPESSSSSTNEEVCNKEKRKRLTKSASSSVDVEVESFEGAVHMAAKQHKRQLKRQQIVRSQSDLNVTSLDSIIEGSARQSFEVDEDLDAEHTIMMNQLEAFDLNNIKSNPKQSSEKSMGATKGQAGSAKESAKNNGNMSEELIIGDGAEFDASKVGRLNGGRRLDYVLQEKPIELFNEYIFAFTSHANYWQNEDSALILLNEIYQQDGVQLFDCFD